MAKPTTDPTWATDAAYDADAEPNKIEPPTVLREEGWERGEEPGAQHVNHLLNAHGEHIEYLHSIVQADGTHSIPSVTRTRIFSALVFRWMLNAISTEAPGRTVAPASGVGRRVRLDSNNVEGVASLNELLPSGAGLVAARLIVVAGTHSVAGRLSLFAKQLNFVTPTVGAGTEVAGVNTSGTGLQVISITGSPIVVVGGAFDTYDLVYDPVGVDDFDLIEGLALSFTDPGPRNF